MSITYILPLGTHNNGMENYTQKTKQKQKKANPMKKIGQGIKDTFIEMSSSLAGWIEDTGNQFTGKKSKSKSRKNGTTATFSKTTTGQPKTN